MTGCPSWIFEKGGGSNGYDGSRRAHIELWVPCRCMKGMKSDWLGHITWRKVEVKIKVSNLERLEKGVEGCNIWQHFTHKIDLTKHEPKHPIYRRWRLGEQGARVGWKIHKRGTARVLTKVMPHPRSNILEARLTSYLKRLYSSYNDKHTSRIMLKEPYSTKITNKETSSHGLGFTSCGPL